MEMLVLAQLLPLQNYIIHGNMTVGDGTTNEQDINYMKALGNGNWQVGLNIANGTNQFYIYDSNVGSGG